MSTLQQQLAQAIAERQALEMSLQSTNAYFINTARSRAAEARSELNRSPGMTSAARARLNNDIARYEQIASSFQSGALPSWDTLTPMDSPIFGDESVGFVPRRPDGTVIRRSEWSGNEVRSMNRSWYDGIASSATRMSSLQTQIDVLQREIAAGGGTIDDSAGPGTGPGPGPGGGGTPGEDGGIVDPTNPNNPSGVPTKPSPRLPEEGRRQTADRPRMDRRRLNIAFGAPRVGVGINIPSY